MTKRINFNDIRVGDRIRVVYANEDENIFRVKFANPYEVRGVELPGSNSYTFTTKKEPIEYIELLDRPVPVPKVGDALDTLEKVKALPENAVIRDSGSPWHAIKTPNGDFLSRNNTTWTAEDVADYKMMILVYLP